MDPRIRTAAELMAGGVSGISLPQLAREVNLSPSYLSRLFKEHIRESPIQYRNAARLRIAKHLLENSFLSVKQIVAACGYNDRSYFSREFKKRYGLAPSLYRKARDSKAKTGISTR